MTGVSVLRRGNVRIDWPNRPEWASTHAALGCFSFGESMESDDFFFTVRDGRGRSHIARGLLEIDERGARVHSIAPEPVLAPGALGAFDDAGVTLACVLRINGRRALMYSGWSLGVSVPFYFFVGVAWEQADGTFVRESQAPLLERSAEDPFLTASPFVLPVENGYRMWYVAATGWEAEPAGPRHTYLIKAASSDDGCHWERGGGAVLDLEGDEFALGRPSVLRVADTWWLFASVRGDEYRGIVARSTDGSTWKRVPGWAVEGTGVDRDHDCRAVAYPHAFKRDDNWYLVWTGDAYGVRGMAIGEFKVTE